MLDFANFVNRTSRTVIWAILCISIAVLISAIAIGVPNTIFIGLAASFASAVSLANISLVKEWRGAMAIVAFTFAGGLILVQMSPNLAFMLAIYGLACLGMDY